MSKIKFTFYTTNPENSVMVETGVTLNGNIASVPITADLFQSLEDGVLNYVVEGELDDNTFIFERQSNYFLKTPVNCTTKVLNLEEQSRVFTENGDYVITPSEGYDGLSQVNININVEGDVCPELTSIDITENGTYEGAYNVVNVNVEGEGGDCNLGDLNVEWSSNWGSNVYYAMNENLDGYSSVYISATNALNERFNQGRESIKNTLTTLDVTENGTYTPPTTPVLVFDGDDMFGLAFADTPNTIEFKIKVNGEGWVFGNETAGMYASSRNTLEIYWFGYKAVTTSFNEADYNTFILKPYDTSNRLVINGVDRSDELTEREWTTDGTGFNLGGSGQFNFVYIKYWSEYSSYNNGDTPLFYTIPNEDGNVKTSTLGGDFEVITNAGAGTCQYMEDKENYGYSSVNVNVIDSIDKIPAYKYAIEGFLPTAATESATWESRVNEANLSSNNGVMYIDSYTYHPVTLMTCLVNDATGIYEVVSEKAYMYGTVMTPNATTIVTPWVYDAGNSIGSILINSPSTNIPLYWFGGWNCENITYIENVFQDIPWIYVYIQYFENLGMSFTSECLFDMGPSNLNADSMISIGNSVYDFSKGPNKYGITTSTVRLNPNYTDEVINLWNSKGWNVEA